MVALTAVTRNLKDATLTISDGGGSNPLVVPIEEGNLSWTETPPEALPVLNRGTLSHFAEGPDNPVTLSFTAKYVAYTGLSASGADPTVIEALKLVGNASGWTQTNTCGPKCVDLTWDLTSPCVAGASDEDEEVVFADFHADSIQVDEGEEYNTVAISGKALIIAPTSTRS